MLCRITAIRALSSSPCRPTTFPYRHRWLSTTPASPVEDDQLSETQGSVGLATPDRDLLSLAAGDPEIFLSGHENESDPEPAIRFHDQPFVQLAITDDAFLDVPQAMRNSVARLLSRVAPASRTPAVLTQPWTEIVHTKFLNPSAVYDRHRSIEYLQNDHFMSHAVLRRILREIKKRRPALHVDRVLDFGAGTGATPWALADEFGQTLRQITCVEPAPFMRDLGVQQTNDLSVSLPECDIAWHTSLPDPISHSITLASFVMGEVHPANRTQILDHLWSCTKPGGILLLVDIASDVCNSVLHQCRSHVLTYDDAQIVAPCPHRGTCPWQSRYGVLLETKNKRKLRRREHRRNFCYFAQRVKLDSFPAGSVMKQRPRTGSRVRFQHEHMIPFVYFVFEKNGDIAPTIPLEGVDQWSRLIRPPIKRGGHVIVEVCQSDCTIERNVVSKRKGSGGPYKLARISSWADLWPYTRVIEDDTNKPVD